MNREQAYWREKPRPGQRYWNLNPEPHSLLKDGIGLRIETENRDIDWQRSLAKDGMKFS